MEDQKFRDSKVPDICVIYCGTNNVNRDTPSASIVSLFQTAKLNAKSIITGLLPLGLIPRHSRHVLEYDPRREYDPTHYQIVCC